MRRPSRTTQLLLSFPNLLFLSRSYLSRDSSHKLSYELTEDLAQITYHNQAPILRRRLIDTLLNRYLSRMNYPSVVFIDHRGLCGRACGVTEQDFVSKNSGFGTLVDVANLQTEYERVVSF